MGSYLPVFCLDYYFTYLIKLAHISMLFREKYSKNYNILEEF